MQGLRPVRRARWWAGRSVQAWVQREKTAPVWRLMSFPGPLAVTCRCGDHAFSCISDAHESSKLCARRVLQQQHDGFAGGR